MKMQAGHEECGHDVNRTEIMAGFQAVPLRVEESLHCHHDHLETLYASDGILEYPMGRYCECCDRLYERF